MNRISRNLSTIYRTERLITRRRIAVVQQQTALMALAGLAALAGLILLNIAFYFVLTKWFSPAVAAGILAFINLVLAGLLATVAGRMSVEDEIAPAVEVRDMAISDLEVELEGMTVEARQTINAIKGLGSNPLGSISALLVPVLTAALKKKS
ncbi:MAG: hypothetical protein ABJI96_02700 [Paracoccaceae bacterium]